jgi:transcriptional regulator of acetoin/glycerol metabolism
MSGARTETALDGDTITDSDGPRSKGRSEVVAPHLFVALACDHPERGVSRHSLANVDRVAVGRSSHTKSDRVYEGSTRVLALGIDDPHLSAGHARVFDQDGSFFVEDTGSRNGTRVNGAEVEAPRRLSDGDILEMGHTLLRFREATRVPLGGAADAVVDGAGHAGPLATIDPVLEGQSEALGKVARSAAPILILGETGTGKEVLARAVHALSGRKGELVAVNCGALTTSLLESQLFGHSRGAFSGAVGDAQGLIRAADGGTLLLDEIGDLPLPAQAALLRALQEREVVPVGGVRPIKVDLRVVAATHRPLEQLAERGAFRQDLLARIAGFTFCLPALRERAEDIGVMLGAFARRHPLKLTAAAGRALLQYDWPLNIRELHQVMQVSVALAGEEPVHASHLPRHIARCDVRRASSPVVEPAVKEEALRQRLVDSLRQHQGNVSHVARDMGKARMQVQRWIKRFGIEAQSFRS